MERPSVDTVDVSAPGDALTSALKAMNSRSWKMLHREAWRQLNLEKERRDGGSSDGTIRLTRRAWDNLPDTIRGYISVKVEILEA